MTSKKLIAGDTLIFLRYSFSLSCTRAHAYIKYFILRLLLGVSKLSGQFSSGLIHLSLLTLLFSDYALSIMLGGNKLFYVHLKLLTVVF